MRRSRRHISHSFKEYRVTMIQRTTPRVGERSLASLPQSRLPIELSNRPSLSAKVQCLLERLDALSPFESLNALSQVVRNCRITLDDVSEHVHFAPAQYHRESVVKTDGYQVLVLGWLPGQKSPIHNHLGAQCCVGVLQGLAVETVFTCTADGAVQIDTEHYAAGSVFSGEDADVHTVENLAEANQGLVTLHIYRPALTRMQLFDLVDGRLIIRNPAKLE